MPKKYAPLIFIELPPKFSTEKDVLFDGGLMTTDAVAPGGYILNICDTFDAVPVAKITPFDE